MTTNKDNNKTRKLDGKDFPGDKLTFGDQSGAFPREKYENSSSLNNSARQVLSSNELNIPGTIAGVDLTEHTDGIETQYPLNQVIETECGHVIEYNDTTNSERILIKHANGSGIDMRPDGSIVVNAQGGGLVEVVSGDHKLIVTGDGQLNYSGNLTLNVTGDFNVNVGGSYNVQAQDETKTIEGPSRDLYYGSKYTTILGSRQDTYTVNYSASVLGNHNLFVKGDKKEAVNASSTSSSTGIMTQTSETQIIQSAPDINIAAQSISVFGDTGTIGGENVIMYNYNMYTGHTVHAADTVSTPTVNTTRVNSTSVHASAMYATAFNGDLTGTADRSISPATNNASSSALGTNNLDNDTETALPTESILSEYLGKGTYGIKKVQVDPGNYLKNAIDKAVSSNNVTRKALTIEEVRARKRDTGHNTNSKFNSWAVQSQTLNPKHSDTTPPAILEVRSANGLTVSARGGVFPDGDPTARVIASTNKSNPSVPDIKHNPNDLELITPATKITNGVTLSQFIYGKGDAGKLDVSLTLNEKKQIVRNLYPHAEFLNTVRNNTDEFKAYNIEVVEGLYTKQDVEIITKDGILDLRAQGRAVVYELTGIEGIVDRDKTFELASWIARNIRYDKIILDYDTYDPDGELNVQIVLIMPKMPKDYNVTFKMESETLYNNKLQEKDFLHIAPEKSDKPSAAEANEPAVDPEEDGDVETAPVKGSYPFVHPDDTIGPIHTYDTGDARVDAATGFTRPFQLPAQEGDYVVTRTNDQNGEIIIYVWQDTDKFWFPFTIPGYKAEGFEVPFENLNFIVRQPV